MSRGVWAVLALLALLPACHKDGQHATPAPELPEISHATHAVAPRNGSAILLIPDDAIVTRGGISGVFALRDGRARFQPVKLGRRAGGNAEVLAGLGGGEKLISGTLADVRDGSPIRNANR